MMKKLLLTLLALVMCLGCCAASAQSEIPEEYIGYWELDSLKLMGGELSAEDMGREGFAVVHEDGVFIFSIEDGEFASSRLHYADGACQMETVDGYLPLVIDEAGMLGFEMEYEGVTMTMCFKRGTAPEVDARLAPFVGEWKMEYATMLGMTLTEEDLGEFAATVYEDGYGILVTDDDYMAFMLKADANGVTWVDNEGAVDPVKVNEQGQLCFDLSVEDLTVTLVMNPVGGTAKAPMQNPVEAPAADAAVDGTWNATKVSVMGIELTMEELDMTMTLDISGDQAVMDFNGEPAECTVTVSGNSVVLSDGVEEIVCELQTDGTMDMVIEIEGLSMMMTLEREGGAPAVVTSAVATPANQASACDYDGLWRTVRVSALGMEFSPEELELGEITFEIEGEKILMCLGEDIEVEGTVRYEADGAVVNDGYTDMPISLEENGQLKAEMESSGITMYLYMVRVGDAELADTQVDYVVVTADSGKIRTEPSISGGLIKTAYKGETYELIEVSGDWYVIDVDGRTGYLHTGVAAIQ